MKRSTPLRSFTRLQSHTPIRASKPISRGEPMRRSPMKRGKSKTSHARRARNYGRMLFVRSLPCGVPDAFFIVAGVGLGDVSPGPCGEGIHGKIECMHLGKRAGWRRCSDDETAPGCAKHHRLNGIDGGVGGHGKWYIALGADGQRALKDELVSQATKAWEALGEAGQRHWHELSAAQFAEWRSA